MDYDSLHYNIHNHFSAWMGNGPCRFAATPLTTMSCHTMKAMKIMIILKTSLVKWKIRGRGVQRPSIGGATLGFLAVNQRLSGSQVVGPPIFF